MRFIFGLFIVAIILISGCTSLTKPRFETTLTIPKQSLEMAQGVVSPEQYGIACKNMCANACANYNMIYRNSEHNVMEKGLECLCQCD